MIKELTLPFVNHGQPFTVHYDIERFVREVLENKEYEDVAKEVAGDNLVVMDVGCNIGSFSLYIYDRAKKIYSIDFGTKNIELLNQTIANNHFDKIKTIQTAVTSDGRDIKISQDINLTDGNGSIYGDKELVHSKTLAQIFKDEQIDHVDMMKVDIEGAEREIFSGTDFLEIKDKIGVIFGEEHGDQGLSVIFPKLGFSYGSIRPHFIAKHL